MDNNIIAYPIQLVSKIKIGNSYINFKSYILLRPFKNIKANKVYINFHTLDIRIMATTLEEAIIMFNNKFIELYLKYKNNTTELSDYDITMQNHLFKLIDDNIFTPTETHPSIEIQIIDEDNILQIIEIDKKIAEAVIILNRRGFYTHRSCQGDNNNEGYITFKNNITNEDMNEIYNIMNDFFPNLLIQGEYTLSTAGSRASIIIFHNRKQCVDRWEKFEQMYLKI